MLGCVFCKIVAREEPAYIIYEDDKFMAFLDKYPQTYGHLQLVPKIHYTWVYEIPEIGEFFATAQKIIRVIIPVLGADHATMLTLGHQIRHAHLWIVPQYREVKKLTEFSLKKGDQIDMQQLATLLQVKSGGGVS